MNIEVTKSFGNLCARLTPREAELCSLMLTPMDQNDAAALLHISVETVKRHMSSIYDKLGVDGRIHMMSLIMDRLVKELEAVAPEVRTVEPRTYPAVWSWKRFSDSTLDVRPRC